MTEYKPFSGSESIDEIFNRGTAALTELFAKRPELSQTIDFVSLSVAISGLDHLVRATQACPNLLTVMDEVAKMYQQLFPAEKIMLWPHTTSVVLSRDDNGLYGFAAALNSTQQALHHSFPVARGSAGDFSFSVLAAPQSTPALLAQYAESGRETVMFDTRNIDPSSYVAMAEGFVNEPFRFRVEDGAFVPVGMY